MGKYQGECPPAKHEGKQELQIKFSLAPPHISKVRGTARRALHKHVRLRRACDRLILTIDLSSDPLQEETQPGSPLAVPPMLSTQTSRLPFCCNLIPRHCAKPRPNPPSLAGSSSSTAPARPAPLSRLLGAGQGSSISKRIPPIN
jgi:hypothetical protein